MSFTVHYFNGKPMSEKDFAQRMSCSTCRGGEWFDSKTYFKMDRLGCDYEEMACSRCFTKYRKLRLLPNILPERCSVEGINNQIKEAEEMLKPEEIKQRADGHDKFSETGVCPGHMWKESYPTITEKGTFVFEACVICRRGRISYEGKRYEDELSNLVRWVLDGGLTRKKKGADKIIKDVDAKADISFDDLFQDGQSSGYQKKFRFI